MFSTGIVADGMSLDGQVLTGPNEVAALRRAGALVLPFDVDRQNEDAPGGYSRSAFGPLGWVVNAPGGAGIMPMALVLEAGRPWVYWGAVLEPRLDTCYGSVRLASDRTTLGAGLTANGDDLVQFNRIEGKRLVIGGRRQVSVVETSAVRFRLRVVGTGFAVLVAAVTQSRIDVSYP